MAIPSDFNEVEHLQSVIRRYLNRQIREDFQDLGGESWEPDVTTTRAAMRHALTHKDNDPMQVTLGRMFLYYFTFEKAASLQTPIYGIPTTFYQQEALSYNPQITLHFKEDIQDIEENYPPVLGEINFRLIDETHKTITENELKTLANKVKSSFGANNGFVWRKGKVRCNYADKSKGYYLQILSRTNEEGQRVIRQVLSLQNHTPDWEYLNISENKEPSQAYPTIPRTERILGKIRRLPRRRPIADVRFTKAEAHIYGLAVPIILYDRSRINAKALVK